MVIHGGGYVLDLPKCGLCPFLVCIYIYIYMYIYIYVYVYIYISICMYIYIYCIMQFKAFWCINDVSLLALLFLSIRMAERKFHQYVKQKKLDTHTHSDFGLIFIPQLFSPSDAPLLAGIRSWARGVVSTHRRWPPIPVGALWGALDVFLGRKSVTGWWFGTFFIFPYIGNLIIPTDFHIFQRGSNHQPGQFLRMFHLGTLW